MRIPFLSGLFAILVLLASPVRAEEETVRRPVKPGVDVDALCGADRGCRLQFLRTNGLRNRRQRMDKDLAQKAVDELRTEKIRREAAPPRDGKPFGTDVFPTTSIIGSGGLVGWSFHKHLRLEIHAGFTSSYADSYTGGIIGGSSVYLGGGSVGTRLKAFWRPDELAFYGAVGPTFLFMSGSVYTPPVCDDFGNCTGGGGGSGMSAEAHGALLAIGLEWQGRIGARVGVEFQYYLPWYVNAYDSTTGATLTALKKQVQSAVSSKAWGFGFNFGWAW